MRTNIDIDDKLMKKAMRATGATTKKGTVEAALRTVVQLKAQEGFRKLRGKVLWLGPDDDWSASDEEIREKRRAAVESKPPMSQHPIDQAGATAAKSRG
jgi:Arc/MetJ family transcription regulator